MDYSNAWFHAANLEQLVCWILVVFGFLLGSVPFGLLIAKVLNKDIRQMGSGNIGATNVSRVIGFWPAGFLTFLLDALKGSIPVLLAMPLCAPLWEKIFGRAVDLSVSCAWAAALAAVIGHCFSPWLRFKGGKGVATGMGAIAVLSPVSAFFGVLAFAVTFLRTRTGSLSSIAGLILASVTYLILREPGIHLWLGAMLVLIILVRHEANIDALLSGNEKTF